MKSLTPQRRSLLVWLAGLAASRAGAQTAAAHAWPSRPLRIVVPYAGNGAIDITARLLAPELQAGLGQPGFVENRPGAQGNIGSAEVARASDGHTLLMGSVGTQVINPLLSSHLPYDPVRDFAPVCLVADMPLVLVVNPAVARSLDIQSVDDLVRVAQARPGRLLVASGGNGNPTHLASELFKRMSQTFMLHFPYRSVGPARHEVIAGNMDLMFDNLPAALPLIRSGKLRALAVTSARRSPSLPDLPTVEEAGGPALKGFEASAWIGLFAPSSQPPEQLARLRRELAAVLAQPALRERMNALGLQPQANSAREFAALIAAETVKWAQVIKLSGVKIDR